jgi:cell division protein FtsI/penicillin-binding protein 2
VVVLIEQGGGGGTVAAPTARKVMESIFPQPAQPAAGG